jgi:hypothetical protein
MSYSYKEPGYLLNKNRNTKSIGFHMANKN